MEPHDVLLVYTVEAEGRELWVAGWLSACHSSMLEDFGIV